MFFDCCNDAFFSQSFATRLTHKQLLSIQKIEHQFIKKAKLPGMSVSLIFPNGEKVYTAVSGNKAFDKKEKINANTLFQVGSVTKTFIAVLMLKLQ